MLLTNLMMGVVILFLWITGALLPLKKAKTSTASNLATSQMAQAFAEQFANEYFTWTLGEDEERAKRLQPFLAQGIDTQAGLQMSSLQQHARPNQVTIWKVEPQGKQQSVITTLVSVTLLSNDDNESEKVWTIKRWLAIPIQAVKEKLVVRSLPYLIPEPPVAHVRLSPKQPKGQIVDRLQKQQIERTLEHFFDVYARGDETEIQYLSKTEKPIRGYRGAMELISLSDVEMNRQGKDVITQGQVRWREQVTKIERIASFTVKLRQDQQRWYVTSLLWT